MSTPAARKVGAPATPSMPNSANSDRFWWGALVVLIFGIAARQLLLGPAPFHPDEAIHAFFAQGFSGYKYNPVYHGPLLYHLVAGVFGVFGEFDFTARLVPSLLGIGLLALALFPMRRFVSNRAAIAGAALLAISPAVVTYSRHLLHDSLVLFLTLGAVLCFSATLSRASDTRGGRNARLGLAAFLALFLATKANFFFVLVMLGAFWVAWRASGLFRIPTRLERWLPMLCFAAITLAAIAFPRDTTFTAVTQEFQHRVFSIIAISGCALFWLWLLSRRPTEEERDTKTDWRVSGDFYALADQFFSHRKLKDDAEPMRRFDKKAALLTYFLMAATALWIYLFLFGQGAQIIEQCFVRRAFPVDTFVAGRESARTAIPQMLDYWGGQQAKPRLPGRHDYYVVLALLYELPILIAAIAGIWHAARHRGAFTDLLLWWSFTSWTVYAVANEKVPWLLVHICLPLALLGGVWLGSLRLSRPLWALGLSLGACFSLRGDAAMIFQRAGDNAEPILYAQTPDAFRDVTEKMLVQTRGDTRALWMNNDELSGKNRQWPSVWYFRQNGPDVGSSGIGLGNSLDIDVSRAGVTTPDDLPNVGAMMRAGWQLETVNFLIWPRANWTAIQPRRYWRWFWTRDTFPQSERGLPQNRWNTSILGGTLVNRVPEGAAPGTPAVPTLIGKGEWSNAEAVVGWRKN